MEKSNMITSEFIKSHPDWMFLYGDNLLQKGEEGHRILYKDLPNCIGIPTKRKPCHRDDSFFYDKDFTEVTSLIRNTLVTPILTLSYSKIILVPGIGRQEDESLLYIHAPLTYHWLVGFLDGIQILNPE